MLVLGRAAGKHWACTLAARRHAARDALTPGARRAARGVSRLVESSVSAILAEVVLDEVVGRCVLDVPDADGVYSLALTRLRVAAAEDVAEVRPAVVAADFGAAAHAHVSLVASVVARGVRVPARVLELARRRVERVATAAARKVARLWEELTVLADAGTLGAAAPQRGVLVLREPLSPLLLGKLERVWGDHGSVRSSGCGRVRARLRLRMSRVRCVVGAQSPELIEEPISESSPVSSTLYGRDSLASRKRWTSQDVGSAVAGCTAFHPAGCLVEDAPRVCAHEKRTTSTVH